MKDSSRDKKKKHRKQRETLFGLPMPLQINVLTGTPITPGGSTSIYDILYTRKHEKPLEEQIYREGAAHEVGFERGFFEGLLGPRYDHPDAPYQVYIESPGTKNITKEKPRKKGFYSIEKAVDFIRTFTGDNPMTNDEIFKKLNTKDGVYAGGLTFRWKYHDPKTGEERRMGSPPNIKIQTGYPPPKLPPWGEDKPPPSPQPKSAKSPAKKRGRPKKNG
jgi:hypothetical protein